MFRLLTITGFILWTASVQGQFVKLEELKAILSGYQAKGQLSDLETAKIMLDSIAVHPETRDHGFTWYYRGYVFKEYFKKKDSGNPTSQYREKAVEYFKKAVSLDKENQCTDVSKSNIKYLATTYFNDAATNLNPDKYELAIKNYELFKSNTIYAEPLATFKQRDLEFYLALASVYTKISESDPAKKKEFFAKARKMYDKVLEIDPDNLGANYNLGILYYNRAVDIINTTNYDVDLVSLSQIQDTCINLFRQSLPYMEHAYHLDPTNKFVLIGLSGIYFSLNEKDKSDKFKKELELIEKEEKK
ncbi:MAG: hypothetical protein HYY40_05135 [Bacteroidetes bacterium]|nr:hypothetical protein [Bacteroidota bacterium]